MMDQEAIVARIEDAHAYVKLDATGAGCGRCHEAGGCQSSILGQLFGSKPRVFRIANPIGAVPGEHVVVRVFEGAMLRAAFIVYGLPTLLLLLGAVVGAALGEAGNNDVSAALGALAGFAVGVLSGLTLHAASVGKVAKPVLLCRSSTCCISKDVRQ